jgi:MOSC domain-containing protein YiiM
VAARWTDDDVAGTVRAVEPWWALATAGLDPVPERLAHLRAAIDADAGVAAGGATLAERGVAATRIVEALSLAGRVVHEAGLGPAAQEGVVAGVFASTGGVPKTPIGVGVVGLRGVEGDRQRSRRHHGRTWQALCLWSADVVDRLAGEGHPVFAGACGENVSVRGVDWGSLRPGTRVRLGSVLAEVTVPSLPCKKNAAWFLDGDFNRMHHERHPGDSRQYALVVEPGEVRAGDAAVVEPG